MNLKKPYKVYQVQYTHPNWNKPFEAFQFCNHDGPYHLLACGQTPYGFLEQEIAEKALSYIRTSIIVSKECRFRIVNFTQTEDVVYETHPD